MNRLSILLLLMGLTSFAQAQRLDQYKAPPARDSLDVSALTLPQALDLARQAQLSSGATHAVLRSAAVSGDPSLRPALRAVADAWAASEFFDSFAREAFYALWRLGESDDYFVDFAFANYQSAPMAVAHAVDVLAMHPDSATHARLLPLAPPLEDLVWTGDIEMDYSFAYQSIRQTYPLQIDLVRRWSSSVVSAQIRWAFRLLGRTFATSDVAGRVDLIDPETDTRTSEDMEDGPPPGPRLYASSIGLDPEVVLGIQFLQDVAGRHPSLVTAEIERMANDRNLTGEERTAFVAHFTGLAFPSGPALPARPRR